MPGRVPLASGLDETETGRELAQSIVLRVVLDLGQAQGLQQRRHIHRETAAQAFLEPVPATDRVVRRASPRLNSSWRCWFLLICAAQRHPVAVLLEHRLQIPDGTKVI